MRQNLQPPDRTPLLPWLMFPIGAEVGFSSAGAGALGSEALLSTRVPRRQLRFALWVGLLILGGQFLFNSYVVWAAPRAEGVSHLLPVHRGQIT
jgi:hypothetical protein